MSIKYQFISIIVAFILDAAMEIIDYIFTEKDYRGVFMFLLYIVLFNVPIMFILFLHHYALND